MLKNEFTETAPCRDCNRIGNLLHGKPFHSWHDGGLTLSFIHRIALKLGLWRPKCDCATCKGTGVQVRSASGHANVGNRDA